VRLERPAQEPWSAPERYWPGLGDATAHLDPPYGVISLDALARNAFDLLDRAKGTPIRVASKSVRVRGVIDAVLALPGYAGVLGYTLSEALWLATASADGPAIDDVVVAYPTADRGALRRLGTSPELAARVTIMVDSVAQLDLVDAAIAPGQREPIRVCIELDASWDSRLFGHIGVRRSPVHSVDEARTLAETIVARPGFTLVGVMGYEAQIAGLTNQPAGKPGRAALVKFIQKRSAAELAERRGLAVAAVRAVAELEFVNGGGTGSIESTVAEDAVTEVAAGSGLFGPHLFDNYGHFHPAPAAAFALSVVRKPTPELSVLLGGGWIASGPSGPDRSPKITWPQGLALLPLEGAGEVQSPVSGPAAAGLAVGDRVWLRHTKAGEISEHLDEFAIVAGGAVVDTLPTYRGQGRLFL
jgi:D-serine deaminase-like pyridoxal phosphate-dependent protein